MKRLLTSLLFVSTFLFVCAQLPYRFGPDQIKLWPVRGLYYVERLTSGESKGSIKRGSIETAKGDDAIEEGYAVVNNTFSNGVNVTFTRAGIYEMYLNFYNQFNELLGSYWFEPVVTQ